MWKLPNGKTISSPKDITIDGVHYPMQIFRKWSKSELSTLGIKPFREEKFDSKWLRSTGTVDTEVDGEIVRTHTTGVRYTVDVAKEMLITGIRNMYIAEVNRSQGILDFYDAIADSVAKKLWSDYVTVLKNDAKLLKDTVNDTVTYEDVIGLRFEWSLAPDSNITGTTTKDPVADIT